MPLLPPPERKLEPPIFRDEVRHGVIAAPDAIESAMFLQALVMGVVKCRQILEDVAGKPSERFCFLTFCAARRIARSARVTNAGIFGDLLET